MPKSRSNKPVTLLFADPTGIDLKKDSYDYILLDVPPSFLQLIRSGGEFHKDGNTWGYVFGNLYDLDDYDHPGCCEIDNGFVSLCRLDHIKAAHHRGRETRDYEKEYGPTRDTPEYLHRVQREYPEILWIGRCPSGCRYGHLHYHVDIATDTVDSIVIDMDYFYDGNIDEHSEDNDITPSLTETSTESNPSDKKEILKNRLSNLILRDPSPEYQREISSYDIISASDESETVQPPRKSALKKSSIDGKVISRK